MKPHPISQGFRPEAIQHHTSALWSAGTEGFHVGGRRGVVALARTLAAAEAVLAVLGIPPWVTSTPPPWKIYFSQVTL